MPPTATKNLSMTSDSSPVAPMSVVCDWNSIITDPSAADGSYPITDLTSISAATRFIMKRPGQAGTTFRARLRYPSGLTLTQNPRGQLFGRVGDSGEWELLKTLSGSDYAEFASAASDPVVATGYKATYCDPLAHAWDTNGNDQFMFGITQALTGSGGTASAASIQAKVI